MTTMQMKRTELLKPDPKNPRRAADDKQLDGRGDHLVARRVLVPLLVKPDGTFIDGWRRWLAVSCRFRNCLEGCGF